MFNKPVEYFGLDIGTSGIRLVQVKSVNGKPTLVTYGSIDIPPKLALSDAPTDFTKIAEYIKQLVKDTKASTKYVTAGVPSTKVFATVITTPKLNQNELSKAIALQADHYIPMAVKDAKLDWYVIGPGKTEQEQEVLLVAAPNTMTEKYLSICEQAGLELMALEPNAVALARAVVQPSDLAVLVLDMGSQATDITIVQANVPKLMRSVMIGGDTFIKAVGQNLGLDETQADQFTKKFGLTQSKLEGQVLKAIKPSFDQVLSEVDKSIKYFSGQYPSVKLEKIILTGGVSGLPELPTYLSTATGLQVEIANAWGRLSYRADLQSTLMGLSTQFGVAVGLAERDML